MNFILLHEYESGKPHMVNVHHIQDFADNEVWFATGRRFKVKETSSDILNKIKYYINK